MAIIILTIIAYPMATMRIVLPTAIMCMVLPRLKTHMSQFLLSLALLHLVMLELLLLDMVPLLLDM